MRSFTSFESKPAARSQIVHFIMSSSMRLKCLGEISRYAGFYNIAHQEPFKIQVTEIADNVGQIPYKLVHQLSTENASFDCLRVDTIPDDFPLLAMVSYLIGARRAADGTLLEENDLVIVAAEKLDTVQFLFEFETDGPKLRYFNPAHTEEEDDEEEEEEKEDAEEEGELKDTGSR